MKKFAGLARLSMGIWLFAWPIYLCSTWVAVGSATAAFATVPQLVALVLVGICLFAIWLRVSTLTKVGGSLAFFAGIAAFALFFVNYRGLTASQTLVLGQPSAITRVCEVVSWFLFVAGYFTLLFGAIRDSRAPRTWLVFSGLYSALIWAWTNFTGTKLLDGRVQRLFDLAILEALFTLSTLLIVLIVLVDFVATRFRDRKRHVG